MFSSSSLVSDNLFSDGHHLCVCVLTVIDVTSSEHQGTFAVVTVVVVLVSGAEPGAVCGQTALPPRRAAVAPQIQPDA